MIAVPIKNPAFSSKAVMPRRLRAENKATMLAAAAKRRPTKNIGPLTVMAFCTSRKVPPQTMVIRISTHSALLNRRVEANEVLEFAAVMALHTIRVRRTMRRSWAVYCANQSSEQYSAQRNFATGFGTATCQLECTSPAPRGSVESDRVVGKIRGQPPYAGGDRGGGEECQPDHP